MAKVTGPLFSLSASGQLAKTLVYMKWKGIQDVRKYVVPANPKSSLQVIQRGYFHSAVDLWHTTTWNALDKLAWNILASVQDSVLSGFNTFIKKVTEAKVEVHTFLPIYEMVVSDIDNQGFVLTAAGVTGEAYTCYYGTTKTNLSSTTAVVNTAGVLVATLTGLAALTDYYVQIRTTTDSANAITGIIKQKTA
jgi:hypothetical protein